LLRFQGVPVSGAPSEYRTKNMKTCLVVDNSKVVRMVARKILEELGFEVIEAEDGQVALDKSMESMPDVVLLDWNMPVMSGIEYLRALRVTE
jgi:two-component system chemotaxis response regulator CheY